jgi:peptidyl-prolyl cis-trans isomerase C
MSKRILLASAALMLGASSLPAIAADNPVVARINGSEIHRSDVIHEIEMMGPQAQQVPAQMLYPQVLQRMISVKLVSAQGYAQKLQNDPDVKEKMKDAEAQIVAETYVHRTVQPKITDAKIKARYDEVVAKFKPEDEVRARHILVKTEDEANDLIKQIKGGADFAKLAGDKSEDKGSAKQGGDLKYFTHDSMVKPFADAAFAMKVGEVSDKPVKTEFGYHVIKVEDKRKSSAPALAELKDQIANRLGQEETDALVKGLEAKAKIEKFNLDGTPLKAAEAKPDAK